MISTRQLHYNKSKNRFCADMSDLGPNPFEQLWPEACDLGLRVQSHVTGRVMDFYIVKNIERDDDCMLLRSFQDDNLTIVLYND